ncbi:hypothetical protein HMPREF9176_0825 [Streptococcus downei F0415]|nr:hypothetical protein HMPREF9176_0825 [Streptococcus downei F0415]
MLLRWYSRQLVTLAGVETTKVLTTVKALLSYFLTASTIVLA